MSERTSAPWRHPALAPGYAAVVAFVAVLVANLFLPTGPPVPVVPAPEVPVTVTAPEVVVTVGAKRGDELRVAVEGVDRLDRARLTVVADDGATDADLDRIERLDLRVPAAGVRVCLSAPPGWTITAPAALPDEPACRSGTGDLVFRLERS